MTCLTQRQYLVMWEDVKIIEDAARDGAFSPSHRRAVVKAIDGIKLKIQMAIGPQE